MFGAFDATCQQSAPAMADGGRVIVEAVDATGVKGTFTAKFGTEELSASFVVPTCGAAPQSVDGACE